MARKPRLLLLDAGAAIVAMQFHAWDALISAYEVVVPTVVIEEAHFYPDLDTGERIPIDLRAEVKGGRIQEATASIDEVRALLTRFTLDFRERIHAGEVEALAYLDAHSAEDICFVSGDGPAIQAVAMLDLREKAISLFEALQACGHSKPLPAMHRPDFVREHLDRGSESRIHGRGLSDEPPDPGG